MEDALIDIIAAIKAGDQQLDQAWLSRLLRRHNARAHDPARRIAKRRLLPFYLGVREHDRQRWAAWGVDPATEQALLRILRMKPRRTASGVATVTVVTKPWPCSSDCLYCPNDVRMPKSYLSDEPACQRAERNYFDPYLQVRSRLSALDEMGHVTDKVELIVLGGTWNDYPEAYQRWFVSELFRACNGRVSPDDAACLSTMGASAISRDGFYRSCGLSYDTGELAARCSELQARVNEGGCGYNEAFVQLERRLGWRRAARAQEASAGELERQHLLNETAAHRVVGLSIETRPDLISPASARAMRALGCTKIQMGIQSLSQEVLDANQRPISVGRIADAFATLRRFGFKVQVHAMVNLLGSTPASDAADYRRLVGDERFCPDEVKLYPCSLVESARLGRLYKRGLWRPYDEEELVGLLAKDVLATPSYVRISRMIRDISSTDIVAGNRKTNLRQLVEARLAEQGQSAREIRQREVSLADVDPDTLRLDQLSYRCIASEERFLQWVDEDGRIAGFLRLSLPDRATLARAPQDERPAGANDAMIREVHVYGRVERIHNDEQGGAQHRGLGSALVEEACAQAGQAGYDGVCVISSVGTRGYYRRLGFADAGLYQRRAL